MALINSGCIAEERAGSQSQLDEGINDSLIKIAGKEQEVNSFIGRNPDYQTEITILTHKNITQLSTKFPVIYGNLPNKTLYKIEYRNNSGILVIVDLENKKVLKYFRTAGVNLE